MKILFRFYTIVYLLLYLYVTFTPEMLKHYGIWEWVDIAVMAVALAGMTAFAFAVRLLVKRFWEYFFYLFIIYELLYMTWLQLPLLEKLNLTDQITVSNAINLFMMLPLAFALHRLQQQWDRLFPPEAQENNETAG